MRRVFPMLLLVGVATLIAGCAWCDHDCQPTCCPGCCEVQQANGTPEPVYEGRSEVEWALSARGADGLTRQATVDALVRTGPSSYCHAAAMLKSDDAGERFTGAEVLRRLGPCSAGASAQLASLVVNDQDSLVRGKAAHALGAFGIAASAETPVLARALDDEIWSVRYHAIAAMGAIGWRGYEFRESLERISHHDSDQRVRDAATVALYKIEEAWITHHRSRPYRGAAPHD